MLYEVITLVVGEVGENAVYPGGHGIIDPERGGLAVRVRGGRITSYNVCYTKLLRILAYLSDDEVTRSSLALAARRGIPVIALESDTIPEARQSFVGVNSFELGRVLGGLIREAVGVSGDALVFLDEAAGYGPENIMLSAIRDTLRASPLIRVTPMVV